MTILLEHLPFKTDAGVSARARVGLVCLASDYTIEHEFNSVLKDLPGVALYVSRIFNDPTVTPETLAAMEARMTDTAATLLPGDRVDAIAYGCTSASMVIGPDRVEQRINAAKPDTPVTNPISSALKAFDAFGAKRIGVLTPYTTDVNAGIQSFIEAAGFEVPVFGSFNEPSDTVVAAISPESIREAVLKIAAAGDLDAVFVSCTSVRLFDQIEALELEVGLPVTSSNHALLWNTLRTAGIDDRIDEFGRLFQA